MKKLLCLVCAFTLLLSGCGSKNDEAKIRVFADSSLTTALNEIVEDYNKENPVNIEIVSGGTGSLYNRIEDGAQCDIFIPASKEQINSLIQDEYLQEKNVTPILKNNMVLIKNYNNDTTVKSFDTVPEASTIAMAKESEPVGSFAREIFINLNVFKQVLTMKTNECNDSPSVAQNIADNKSDVGVCFETDALAYADKIQIITLAPSDSLNSQVLYSVAVLNTDDGTDPNDNIKDFATYLDSPEAAEVFTNHDFDVYIEDN